MQVARAVASLAVASLAALLLTAGAAPVAGASSTAAAETNVTAFIAPGSDLPALRAGNRANATLTPRPRVATSDVLVLRLGGPGLGRAVAARPENDTTAAFEGLLGTSRASLSGVEVLPDADRTRNALALTGTDATSVARVDENTVDLIVDTDALRATADDDGDGRADDGPLEPVEPGQFYRISFAFDGQSASTSVGVFPETARFWPDRTDDPPPLFPLPEQTLTADTTLAPGNTVTVAFRSDGDPAARASRRVRIREPIRSLFDATLNLSEATGGTRGRVTISHEGRRIAEQPITLTELTAAFAVDRSADNRIALSLDSASFSHAGFLVVRDGGPDGQIIGNRFLPAGEYDSLTVRYTRSARAEDIHVSAIVDVDRDQILDANGPDRPFRTAGDPVADRIELDPIQGTPETPVPTTTTPPTTTAAPTEPGSEPPVDGSTPVGPDRPTFTPYTISGGAGDGFGVLLGVLGFLGSVALLARRE